MVLITIPVEKKLYTPLPIGEDKCMAGAISSMIGRDCSCNVTETELQVWFQSFVWAQFKKDYGKKWRSNLTHEIKRHSKMKNYKADLRNLKIMAQ